MIKQALLVCLLLTACLCNAQQYSIYQNITTGNGLPSNYVFAAGEDPNGTLWIGTDKGLCSYDGFRWQTWDKDNGLPGNYVNKVLSDGRGGLWLGISEKGYYHFSPPTKKAEKLPLPGALVFPSLQTDSDGNLYLETNGSQGFQGLLFHPAAVQRPEVIFSCNEKLPFFIRGSARDKKIYCLWSNRDSFAKARAHFRSRWPLQATQVPAAAYTNQQLYALTDSVLLTSTHYNVYSQTDGLTRSLPLFASNNTYAFSCGTAGGLYVYDVKTGYYFINRRNEARFYDHRSGLGADHINEIFETKDGTVIICTLGAGLQLIKHRYRKTFFTGNRDVRTVLPAGNEWYVLAGDHLFKTAGTAQTLTPLGNAGTATLQLFRSGNTLLVGTLRGVGAFREKKDGLQRLSFLEITAGISSILPRPKGYLAGTYGAGLVSVEERKAAYGTIPYPLRIVEKLAAVPGGFAALSYEDGLLLTDTTTGQHRRLLQRDGLPSGSVYSVHACHDTLWIGAKGGIGIYDGKKIVRSILFPAGMAQEKVIAIFHDHQNRLWAVGSRWLYQVAANTLRPLASHPLVTDDDVVETATYNAQTNQLGIGSNKTFSLIDLSAIEPDETVSEPRLTRILLDEKTIAAGPVAVPYGFHRLQISLAPLSASPFTRNRFFYKLEGFENRWTEFQDSLSVSLAGLRPGRYVFWAKAVNPDGYESKEVRLMAFTVQLPFWQRWPFLLLCMLAVVGLTVMAVQWVEKRKQRKRAAAALLRQTVQAERERIARDLHDHLGTNLATIIAQTDQVETRLHKGDVQQAGQGLQSLSAHTRETMNVLRETIWAVQETAHRLDDFVLRTRTFLHRFFEDTGIVWEVKELAPPDLLLSPAQTLHLFRIIQEASQNVLKHADATRVSYAFSKHATDLQLVITDNGRGFRHLSPATNGFLNMHERVQQLKGSVRVEGLPSVTITVRVPV